MKLVSIYKENSRWDILYENRLHFIKISVNEFLVNINNKKYNMLKINQIEMYKIIVENIKMQNRDLEKDLGKEIDNLEKKLMGNENKFIRELDIQYDLIRKITNQDGEWEKVFDKHCNSKEIILLKEELSNSIKRVDKIKNKRIIMERRLKSAIYKAEKIIEENELNIEQTDLFKDIIEKNYIMEYNKVVKLINSKTTLNKDLITYYEYLYLITIEMEKVEEDIYG